MSKRTLASIEARHKNDHLYLQERYLGRPAFPKVGNLKGRLCCIKMVFVDIDGRVKFVATPTEYHLTGMVDSWRYYRRDQLRLGGEMNAEQQRQAAALAGEGGSSQQPGPLDESRSAGAAGGGA